MTIKCRAAILREIGLPQPYAQTKPLIIEDITLEPPKSTDLVVKVAGAGLCHSDLSVINGARGRDVPLAMGHEGSGEVVEVGSAIILSSSSVHHVVVAGLVRAVAHRFAKKPPSHVPLANCCLAVIEFAITATHSCVTRLAFPALENMSWPTAAVSW